MVFSEGCNFREFRVLEKIIHRKQKNYMVHTLFLTDSRKFNPTKYTTYTVQGEEGICSVALFKKKKGQKGNFGHF